MSAPPISVMEVAREAALQAGAIIREGSAQPLEIAYKGQGEATRDPVTDVDRRSEAAIAATIQAHFPHHRLLAEEGATGGDDPHWRWIVDPLDGTINYAHRLPFSCVSIAAEYAGEVVAGVVYNPLAEELFAAERGRGATLNGQPIHVSRTDALRRAVLTSAFGPWEANGRRYHRGRALSPHVQALRDLGSAALELCYVACGRVDGMGGSTLNAWDVAAGALIVREAGGQVTDANGDPFTMDGKHVVVSNGLLHGAILARLHDESEPLPPQDRGATVSGGETASRSAASSAGAHPRRAARQPRRGRILVALPVLLDAMTGRKPPRSSS